MTRKTPARGTTALATRKGSSPVPRKRRTEPLRRRDQVVSRMRLLIQELTPGDRLPSERDLAERFRASRSTVREALQFLGALGLLDVRQGEGSFLRVAPGNTRSLRATWREWVSAHRGRVLELIETRMGCEALAAELAARRAAPEHLERMAEALREIKSAGATGDTTAFVQADLAFHDAVLRACGNATLREVAVALGQELVPERAALADLDGRAARSYAEHRAIYDAICASDGKRAAAALRAHLMSVHRDVLAEVLGEAKALERSANARGSTAVASPRARIPLSVEER